MAIVVPLLVVMLGLGAIATLAVRGRRPSFLHRSRRHGRSEQAARPAAPLSQLSIAPIEPDAEAETDLAAHRDAQREEMRLVTLLLDGQLPPVWYRQRMAELAAAETARHHVDHPPHRAT
jgi:hypothetical protein